MTVNRNKLLYNKTKRRANSEIHFSCETLHVLGNSSTHHQELATVHSALVRVIQVWRQLVCSSALILHANCRQTCITCSSAECTVANSWWWVEEIPETYRFLYKNKFGNECVCWFHWKVIYYDARSYERKITSFNKQRVRKLEVDFCSFVCRSSKCKLISRIWQRTIKFLRLKSCVSNIHLYTVLTLTTKWLACFPSERIHVNFQVIS